MNLESCRGWLAAGLLVAGPALAGVLSPGLERQLAESPADATMRVLLALEDQADVPALDQRLRDERAGMARRHAEVLTLLRETATRSQAPLLAELESLKAAGKVFGFTPHWLVNSVVVAAPASVVPELAHLAGVGRVEADLVPELIAPVTVSGDREDGEREIGITPGVVAVQADRVWYELGITGQGAIVANMDTGVRRTHEALSARWRGNFAPASHCWWDAWGNSTQPSDGQGHGSHVMGTITGQAPNDSIGVCPGALWIATNVIAGGTGAQFDNAVITGLEWLSDPDGDPFTVDDMPDVVQHSWGVNEQFSGYQDCDSRWWTALDNCEAAGVCNTWSAGNEGPGGTSMRSPGDRATTATNAFSVGSVSYNAPYTISSFSSRGPSGCGGVFAVKPEVVAPGSNIYSVNASGDTGYTNMDGTSMAGPHVAGVVGLMRSANPDLDVHTIKTILMETATPLGTPGEDNTYGWGLVNAYEAVLASMTGFGTVHGTVTNAGGAPLEGVLVQDAAGDRRDTTDELGQYSLQIPAGEVSLEAFAYGYQPGSAVVTVEAGGDHTADFALAALPQALVAGVVHDANGQPLEGAFVTVSGPGMPAIAPLETPFDGSFAFSLPVGQQVTVSSRGSLDNTAVPLGPDTHGYRAFDPADADWDVQALVVAPGGNQLELRGRNRAVYGWTTLDPEQGGSGTPLTFMADDQTFTVELPFSFRYYGQDFTQLSVCGNGWVSLGASISWDYSNSSIPAEDGPSAMLAAAWDDYSPQQAVSGNVSTWHDAAHGRFIVEYNHIRQYNPATAFESFQVILLDPALHPTLTGDGAVIFQYAEITNLESATVGIESPDETTGLQYYEDYDDTDGVYGAGCQPITEGLAILFTTGMLPSTLLAPVTDLAIGLLPGLQLGLSWSPAAGATSYRVERAGADGQWQTLGETTGTSWTDSHATGTRLYRVVSLAPDGN
jgi:subtilisin family serine protease